MNRFYFALDLIDDPNFINEYEYWHQKEHHWPEIKESILDTGILNMEIYRTGNRLILMMQTDDSFSFERKGEMDATNPKVQEWESMMSKFQKPLSWAKSGEKWVMMNKIFSLNP